MPRYSFELPGKRQLKAHYKKQPILGGRQQMDLPGAAPAVVGKALRLQLFDLLGKGGEHLKEVAHDAVVRHVEDGGVGGLVDGHDAV